MNRINITNASSREFNPERINQPHASKEKNPCQDLPSIEKSLCVILFDGYRYIAGERTENRPARSHKLKETTHATGSRRFEIAALRRVRRAALDFCRSRHGGRIPACLFYRAWSLAVGVLHRVSTDLPLPDLSPGMGGMETVRSDGGGDHDH